MPNAAFTPLRFGLPQSLKTAAAPQSANEPPFPEHLTNASIQQIPRPSYGTASNHSHVHRQWNPRRVHIKTHLLDTGIPGDRFLDRHNHQGTEPGTEILRYQAAALDEMAHPLHHFTITAATLRVALSWCLWDAGLDGTLGWDYRGKMDSGHV